MSSPDLTSQIMVRDRQPAPWLAVPRDSAGTAATQLSPLLAALSSTGAMNTAGKQGALDALAPLALGQPATGSDGADVQLSSIREAQALVSPGASGVLSVAGGGARLELVPVGGAGGAEPSQSGLWASAGVGGDGGGLDVGGLGWQWMGGDSDAMDDVWSSRWFGQPAGASGAEAGPVPSGAPPATRSVPAAAATATAEAAHLGPHSSRASLAAAEPSSSKLPGGAPHQASTLAPRDGSQAARPQPEAGGPSQLARSVVSLLPRPPGGAADRDAADSSETALSSAQREDLEGFILSADVIGSTSAMRSVFRAAVDPNSPLSVTVHRLGPTLLLDGDPVQAMQAAAPTLERVLGPAVTGPTALPSTATDRTGAGGAAGSTPRHGAGPPGGHSAAKTRLVKPLPTLPAPPAVPRSPPQPPTSATFGASADLGEGWRAAGSRPSSLKPADAAPGAVPGGGGGDAGGGSDRSGGSGSSSGLERSASGATAAGGDGEDEAEVPPHLDRRFVLVSGGTSVMTSPVYVADGDYARRSAARQRGRKDQQQQQQKQQHGQSKPPAPGAWAAVAAAPPKRPVAAASHTVGGHAVSSHSGATAAPSHAAPPPAGEPAKASVDAQRQARRERRAAADASAGSSDPSQRRRLGFRRVAFWNFRGMRLVLGSDILVLRDAVRPAAAEPGAAAIAAGAEKPSRVSVAFRDARLGPLSRAEALDLYVENAASNVPELVLCHVEAPSFSGAPPVGAGKPPGGVGVERIATEDIAALSRDPFSPYAAEASAASLLTFLQVSCRHLRARLASRATALHFVACRMPHSLAAPCAGA